MAPPAHAKAVTPAAIAPIKKINGIISPLRSIVSEKVVLLAACLTSTGNSFICSWFKNLDLNLLQIEHTAFYDIYFFVSLLIIIGPIVRVKSLHFKHFKRISKLGCLSIVLYTYNESLQ